MVNIVESHPSQHSPCARWRVIQKDFHFALSVVLLLLFGMPFLAISVHLNTGFPQERLQFDNFRAVLGFISSFIVVESFQPFPSHDHRNRSHLSFLQDLDTPSHTHCPPNIPTKCYSDGRFR